MQLSFLNFSFMLAVFVTFIINFAHMNNLTTDMSNSL